MRTVFKTSYDADINMFQHGYQFGWYALLLVIALVLPFYLGSFWLGEMTSLLIWSIACMGLMILVGQTGQASLGHAAFLAIGAYANVLLQQRLGLPFIVSFPLAGLIAGICGALIALPDDRLHGIYLAIGTLAITILVDDFIVIAAPLTNGVQGLFAPTIDIFGLDHRPLPHADPLLLSGAGGDAAGGLFYRNLMRSPLGRAFAAVRDSEISAQAMGVNIARTKAISFGISAGITGLAGRADRPLCRHLQQRDLQHHHLDPAAAGHRDRRARLHPRRLLRGGGDRAPAAVDLDRARQSQLAVRHRAFSVPGMETAVFGLILIVFMLFEPRGIYGRWLKIRTYFELFPFYRKDMFRRQKSYLKTERMR
jgi:branched-chain amino acid transport system permease protein